MRACDYVRPNLGDDAWREQVAVLPKDVLDELGPLLIAAAYSLLDKARFVREVRGLDTRLVDPPSTAVTAAELRAVGYTDAIIDIGH